MNTKPVIFALSLVAGLSLLATTGIMGASAKPAYPHIERPELSVVSIPEVTIMGELPRVITVPEVVITATPSHGKLTSRQAKVAGRNLVHTLAQGGSPSAQAVRAWGM